MTERAPAKINLCLLVGPARATDGRHELVTVFEPLALHDTVALVQGGVADADEVVCPGVDGDNLAARALRDFRAATGWDGPPVRLVIEKRIPVAGGMAGGSADAAAALRLARRASGRGDDALLHELAFGLGADVPSQLVPRRLLGTGAGERLEPLPPSVERYGVLVLPSHAQLSTADVFREGDRLGIQREHDELAATLGEIRAGTIPPVNDLEVPAISLLPAVGEALEAAREVGAERAMVSGSGPTVVGLFATRAGAARAADALRERGWPGPPPLVTEALSG